MARSFNLYAPESGDKVTFSQTQTEGTPIGTITINGTPYIIYAPEGSTTAGADGKAATITIGETTTGDPGTDATVTNTGTENDAVLNFTIPRGEQGEKGDAGETGATGADGAAGVSPTVTATGATGSGEAAGTITGADGSIITVYNGAQGEAGTPGTNGTNGTNGESATITIGTTTTGDAGTEAAVTNSGTESAAILNFTIPKGEKGDQGEQGVTGPAGADGTTVTWNQAQTDGYEIGTLTVGDTAYTLYSPKLVPTINPQPYGGEAPNYVSYTWTESFDSIETTLSQANRGILIAHLSSSANGYYKWIYNTDGVVQISDWILGGSSSTASWGADVTDDGIVFSKSSSGSYFNLDFYYPTTPTDTTIIKTATLPRYSNYTTEIETNHLYLFAVTYSGSLYAATIILNGEIVKNEVTSNVTTSISGTTVTQYASVGSSTLTVYDFGVTDSSSTT